MGEDHLGEPRPSLWTPHREREVAVGARRTHLGVSPAYALEASEQIPRGVWRLHRDFDIVYHRALILCVEGIEEEIVGNERGEGREARPPLFGQDDHPTAEQAGAEDRQSFVDREIRAYRPGAAACLDSPSRDDGEASCPRTRVAW